MSTKRVLFVCTGNTCRSPMAAGIVKFFLGEMWQAYSAGIEPGKTVNPNAIAVMDELNIDIRDHQPQATHAYQNQSFDAVIILGEYPYQQFVAWPDINQLIFMPFADPYGQPIEVYRQTRNDIQNKIVPLLRDL